MASEEKGILLLKPRGFCAGVVRAIDIVELALKVYGPPIYVRKEIVHNRHVVQDLATRGAIFIDELSEVPAGSRTVYSAHGVAPAVRREASERGLDVILKIDVQGAATVRQIAGGAVSIFLSPPSIDELAQRLEGRMSETRRDLVIRLKAAEREMERAGEFDYVVVNATGRIDDTIREIESILERERRRSPPRRIAL